MDDQYLAIRDEELDSDLAQLAEAAQDLTQGDMVGVVLKFVEGNLLKKNTATFDKVGAVQQFIVDMRSYKRGWIRWEDKKPTHRYVGRVVDRFPLPVRDRLPGPGLNGTKDDPWQETP